MLRKGQDGTLVGASQQPIAFGKPNITPMDIDKVKVPHRFTKAGYNIQRDTKDRNLFFFKLRAQGYHVQDIIKRVGWPEPTVRGGIKDVERNFDHYAGMIQEAGNQAAEVAARRNQEQAKYCPDDEIRMAEVQGEMVWCNISRAERNIRWIEAELRLDSDGDTVPFKLTSMQRRLIFEIYAPVESETDHTRIVRRALLSCGRQNGKTELCAAIVLLHIFGPEAVRGSNIVCGAVERLQAKVLFEKVTDMIDYSDWMPEKCKVVPSQHRLTHKELKIKFRSLSRTPRAAQGTPTSLFICDELAEHPTDELFEAMNKSQGSFTEPLGVIISTRSGRPDNPLEQEIAYAEASRPDGAMPDRTYISHVYCGDDDIDFDDWDQVKEQVKKANPDVGFLPKWVDIEGDYKKALLNPKKINEFLTRRLNLNVGAQTALFDRRSWEQSIDKDLELEDLYGKLCYGGLDLSQVHDLTSFVLYFPTENVFWCWNWMPEELYEEFKFRNAEWEHWYEEGHFYIAGEKAIDYGTVAEKIISLCKNFRVANLAYDRAYMSNIQTIITERNLEFPPLTNFSQGGAWMHGAVNGIEGAVERQEIKHVGNPLVNMAAHQVEVKVNDSGYRKLHKANSEYRIDPISALTMAYGVAGKKGVKTSDYSDFDNIFGAPEPEDSEETQEEPKKPKVIADDWSNIFKD